MLTHQPPSAWAKREKKYHDDKKAWDSAQAELAGKVKRLNDEVRTLKDNNRAVILQEQLQVKRSVTEICMLFAERRSACFVVLPINHSRSGEEICLNQNERQ